MLAFSESVSCVIFLVNRLSFIHEPVSALELSYLFIIIGFLSESKYNTINYNAFISMFECALSIGTKCLALTFRNKCVILL